MSSDFDSALPELQNLLDSADQAAQRYGWGSLEHDLARHHLVAAQRQLAEDHELEHAVQLDLGVCWNPNAPHPLLLHDGSTAVLTLNAHMSDPDQRRVGFRWEGCAGAVLGGPNDETISGHRLYDWGLADCVWSAEVRNSKWIAGLERQNSVHPQHDQSRYANLRHFVLLLKDHSFETVALQYEVHRIPATVPAAAKLLERRSRNS